jgi:hypothetical protein
MDLALIKLFFELLKFSGIHESKYQIFKKNEVHVAKSFGKLNEALLQWLS